MKWVTEEEAAAAGAKSKKAAIACSYKHWRQMATATLLEWKKWFLANNNEFPIFTDHCALCHSFYPSIGETGPCHGCVLFQKGKRCHDTGQPYEDARDILVEESDGSDYFCDLGLAISSTKRKPAWLKDFQAKALLVTEQIKGFM